MAIRIGKFEIFESHTLGKLWIDNLDEHGAEGGEFNEKALEEVINKFYKENF